MHKDKQRIDEWTKLPALSFLVQHLHTGHDELPQSEMGKAAKSLEECIAVLARDLSHPFYSPVNPNIESRMHNMCHAWKALEQEAQESRYYPCVHAISAMLAEELNTNVHVQQYLIHFLQTSKDILHKMPLMLLLQERNVSLLLPPPPLPLPPLCGGYDAGGMALHQAIDEGLHTRVEALVPFVNVNARNGEGLTPLASACNRGNIAIIEMLISSSKTETTCTYGADGWFPLLLALRVKSAALLKNLLAHPRTNVNQCTEPDGLCALTYACRCSGIEAIKSLLIKHNIDTNNNGSRQNGVTPLMELVKRNMPEGVKLLLEHQQCNPNKPSFLVRVYTYKGGTHAEFAKPLWLAARDKHYKIVHALVHCKSIDMDKTEDVLWQAVRNRDNAMAELLVVHGSNPTALTWWPYNYTWQKLKDSKLTDRVCVLANQETQSQHILTAVAWGFQADADAMLRQGRLGTLKVDDLKPVLHQEYFAARFARGWRPTTHYTYDDAVRQVVNTVMLMCSCRETGLPVEMWMHVFKFLCRSHFAPPPPPPKAAV